MDFKIMRPLAEGVAAGLRKCCAAVKKHQALRSKHGGHLIVHVSGKELGCTGELSPFGLCSLLSVLIFTFVISP